MSLRRPGTGKTILASVVVDNLRRSEENVIYYFFDSRDDEISAAASMLNSLVAQMKRIKSMSQRKYPPPPKWVSSPLARLFHEFSECAMEFEELYCCIDAIDEADEWKIQLMRNISDSVQSEALPVKFFITSRSSDLFLSSLGQLLPFNFQTTRRFEILEV